jgi:hypothetical protein
MYIKVFIYTQIDKNLLVKLQYVKSAQTIA